MALRSPLTVQPYDYIGDSTGRPLDKGQIYIGVAGQDPEFYQIPVFLDAEMTKLIDQPIRTNDGFVDFAGSLSELYASAEVYSLKVLDKQGRKVIYKAEMMRDNLTDDALQSLDDAIAESQAQAVITTTELVNESIDDIMLGEYQTQLEVKVDGISDDVDTLSDNFSDLSVDVSAQKLDTGITATAKFGGVERTQADVNSDVVSVKDFGAIGDGVTDDSRALKQAFNLIKGDKSVAKTLSGGGYLYNTSKNIPIQWSNISLKDANFVVPASTVFDGVAVLECVDGIHQSISNVRMDLNYKANGISSRNLGYGNHYSDIYIKNPKDFGINIQAGGSNTHWLSHVMVGGDMDKSLWPPNSKGVVVNVADVKMDSCVINNSETPLTINNNTFMGTGNHIYNENGAAKIGSNSTNIRIKSGFGASFAHTYLDRGKIVITNSGNAAFFDTKLLFEYGEHEVIFVMASDSIGKKFPKTFTYDGSTSTNPLTDGSMRFIDLVDYGSNNWDSSAKNIVAELNNRVVGGYPRIVSHETSQLVAANRAIISDGDEQTIHHSLSTMSFVGNTLYGVHESYSKASVTHKCVGIRHNTIASGGLDKAVLGLQGSKDYYDSAATIELRNRHGLSALDFNALSDTDKSLNQSGWDISLKGSALKAMDSLDLNYKEYGSNTLNDSYKITKSAIHCFDHKDLGTGVYRWNNIYLINNPNVSSDIRLKVDISNVNDAEKLAAVDIKGSIKKYRMKGSDDSELHFGVIAQEVITILNKHGLSEHDYGFIQYDLDSDRYAIRYGELSMFLLATQ